MSEAAAAADRCPLCRGPNGCGLVAGRASCWCFATRMPAEVIERVPAEARGRACICQTCARVAVTSPAAPGGPADR